MKQKNHSPSSSSYTYNSVSSTSNAPIAPTYSLYRKMGKFSFNGNNLPSVSRFGWLLGGRGPQKEENKDYFIESIRVDSRTNYTCYAINGAGNGLSATVNLDVQAPPVFIKNMLPYTGHLHSADGATLTCHIECVPRCDISWQKDSAPIERNDTRYFIKEKYMDASLTDFESMLSVLVSKGIKEREKIFKEKIFIIS